MAAFDLLIYHDLDTSERPVPPLGTPARAWLGGEGLEGLYVAAVCPPIHEGCQATVVLAHRHDRMPELIERLTPPAA